MKSDTSPAVVRRVLVVDDEPAICDLISEVLVSDGWIVDKAHSAEEAIELFSMHRYDLITLDCGMPDVDGRAFHQTLSQVFGHGHRTAPFLPERLPPILVISGWYDESEVQEMIFGERIIGILGKPIACDKLIEIAHDAWLLDEQRRRRREKALSRISDRLVAVK
jgi:CheY-like chemotaxis protein